MNYAQFPPVSTKDKQGLSKEFFTLSSCALVCADVSTVIISNDKIIAPPLQVKISKELNKPPSSVKRHPSRAKK